jgi:hypothetical protein
LQADPDAVIDHLPKRFHQGNNFSVEHVCFTLFTASNKNP